MTKNTPNTAPHLEALERQSVDPLARFAAIEQQRRQLEGQLEALAREAAELETQILDAWAERGQRKATVRGLSVFVRAEMYCSKRPQVSGQEMARTLLRLGLGQIISYNAAGLKSYVKQRLAAAKESQGIRSEDDIPAGIELESVLPPELAAVITVGENVRLRTRLSK